VSHYLKRRTSLCLVFALIDSGIAPQEIDLAFVEWLARNGVPFVLVFTKTDKEPPATVAANIAAFSECIAGWFEQLPAIYHCSATLGQGRSELLGVIGATLDAIPAEPEPAAAEAAPLPEEIETPEAEPPFDLKIRAGTGQDETSHEKKKFKGARPW